MRPFFDCRHRRLPMNAIFTRTSVRSYEDRPVEEEKITMILRAAMASPSACNQQPWEFYVATDKKVLERLSGTSPYAGMVRSAPAAIVVCCRTSGLIAPEYGDIDCAIATENILLEIEELGLGGVMIGTSPIPERMAAVAGVLGLPEGLRAFTIVPFGYPKSKPAGQDRFDASRVHYVR